MARIFYSNDSDRSHGCVVLPTAPFKGVCQRCGKRTIVRNYPYNCESRLGTYCPGCFREIDSEISSAGVFSGGDND